MKTFPLKVYSDQDVLDSLWYEYNNAEHDTTRIIILNEGIGLYYEGIYPDSALTYYNKSLSIANEALGKKNNNALKPRLLDLKAETLRYIGIVYRNKGEYGPAFESFFNALEISLENENEKLSALCYTNIGNVYADQGRYDLALLNFHKALDSYYELDYRRGISISYNNIGVIHYFQRDLEKTVEFYSRSLEIKQELGDRKGVAVTYNNTGIVFLEKGDPHKAIESFTKALQINKELKDNILIKGNYFNLGDAYKSLERYYDAYGSYQIALEIAIALGDKHTIAMAYEGLSDLFKKKAYAVEGVERSTAYENALKYGNLSLNIATEINALPLINRAAKTLRDVSRDMGSFENALIFADIYSDSKDSLFKQEKTQAIAEMQIRYDTDQKIQEIESQKIFIEKRELDYQRQRQRLNFFIIGVVLLCLLLVAIFVAYKQRVRSSEIISEKNQMLEQANEEIRQQKEELQTQTNALEKINASLEETISKELEKSRKKDFLLIQQSRQAAMGEMIANIAHQWRQPLNAVGLIVQNFQDAYEYGEMNEEYLEGKVKQTMDIIQYMSQTINDFRDFFKPEKTPSQFDVKATVMRSLSFVEDTLKKSNIIINTDLQNDVFAFGFANEYAQVVLNLINNAKDALLESNAKNPLIIVSLSKINSKSCLTIIDNGGGIPVDIADKIFNPYFSTKKEGQGTGLGLYMSKTIIEKNEGGSLKFENTDNGVKFIVVL